MDAKPTNPQCPKCWSYNTTTLLEFNKKNLWAFTLLSCILFPLLPFALIGWLVYFLGKKNYNWKYHCENCKKNFQIN